MAKRGLLMIGLLVLTAPAAAMDWLTPSLESQRYSNLLKPQQRLHQQRQKQGEPKPQTQTEPSITAAQRQAAWSRHKDEYRKVLLREGHAGAVRWLDQQILAGR